MRRLRRHQGSPKFVVIAAVMLFLAACVLSSTGCTPSAAPRPAMTTPTLKPISSSPPAVSADIETTPITRLPPAVPADATSDVPSTQVLPPTSTVVPRTPTLILQNRNIAEPHWSPDSQWVAFWILAGQEDLAQMKPGFYNIGTNELCYHDELTGAYYPSASPSYTYWLPDNRAVVVVDNQRFIGEPCGSFKPTQKDVLPLLWSDSPNSRYRSLTVYDEETSLARTTITEIETNSIVNTIDWQTSEISRYSTQWISEDQLLLVNSDERGPLLMTVSGNVLNIIPEFFSLNPTELPDTTLVTGALDRSTRNYHFLLNRGNLEDPLLLYHSETGAIEELPFRNTWGITTQQSYRRGFSPDGRWLLLHMPITEAENDYFTDWVRSVDGANEEAFAIGQAGGAFWGTESTGLVAFIGQRLDDATDPVMVMTFPEGNILQNWLVSGYSLGPVEWSPSSELLLLMGWHADTGEWALFLASADM